MAVVQGRGRTHHWLAAVPAVTTSVQGTTSVVLSNIPLRGAHWAPNSCHIMTQLPLALALAQAKREQLKREGKLLTGKAKEEAERRAAIAAQLLAKAAEKGASRGGSRD